MAEEASVTSPGLPIMVPERAVVRLETLDILRGVAILLILLINIPAMGNSAFYHLGDPALDGWSHADQVSWSVLHLLVEGTQRGLLELLFGASALILLRTAMQPCGSVSSIDIYFERALWLGMLGLFDIFVVGWFGDILLEYALAALLLFSFRRMRARWLPGFVLAYLVAIALATAPFPPSRPTDAHPTVTNSGAVVIAPDQAAALKQPHALPAKLLADERAARFAPATSYWAWLIGLWSKVVVQGVPSAVAEIFFTSLLGMALFKTGLLQSRRSRTVHVGMVLVGYGLGILVRAVGVREMLLFHALPSASPVLLEVARLAVTLGHVGLIVLLVGSGFGRLLRAFAPVGRMALTLYLTQNFVGLWVVFPGTGFGLWGRYGWFGLSVAAILASGVQMIIANLWLARFRLGPVEWIWRSLTLHRFQPFRRAPT